MDEHLWHKCSIIIPRRTVDGRWTRPEGQVWRRKVNGRWQYQQDPETDEEWLERNTSGF
jgi:hypothetical protein